MGRSDISAVPFRNRRKESKHGVPASGPLMSRLGGFVENKNTGHFIHLPILTLLANYIHVYDIILVIVYFFTCIYNVGGIIIDTKCTVNTLRQY